MHYFSDLVTIRFFCIETNEWVSFWAPGYSGPKPSTLPLPPKSWITKNVMNNVDLASDSYDVQAGEGDEFEGQYETKSETEIMSESSESETEFD